MSGTQKRWVVRVVTYISCPSDIMPGVWLEQLRHAGLVKVHRDDDNGQCFDIMPPPGAHKTDWARIEADRMSSFGINAVAAPEWKAW